MNIFPAWAKDRMDRLKDSIEHAEERYESTPDGSPESEFWRGKMYALKDEWNHLYRLWQGTKRGQ